MSYRKLLYFFLVFSFVLEIGSCSQVFAAAEGAPPVAVAAPPPPVGEGRAALKQFLAAQDYAAAYRGLKPQVGKLSDEEIIKFLLTSNKYKQWDSLTSADRAWVVREVAASSERVELKKFMAKQDYGAAFRGLRTAGNAASDEDLTVFLLTSNGYAKWGALTPIDREWAIEAMATNPDREALGAHMAKQNYCAAYCALRAAGNAASDDDLVEFLLTNNGFAVVKWYTLAPTDVEWAIEKVTFTPERKALGDFLGTKDYSAAYVALKKQVGHLPDEEIIKFLLTSNGYARWAVLGAADKEWVVARVTKKPRKSTSTPLEKARKRLIALGKGNATAPELTAAQKLLALGKASFSVPELEGAQRLITLGNENFTDDDLTWVLLTPAGRAAILFDAALGSNNFVTSQGLLTHLDKPAVKALALDLLAATEVPPIVLPDRKPANFMLHFFSAGAALKKAHTLLRHVREDRFTLPEAKEFFWFKHNFMQEAGNVFTLTLTPEEPLTDRQLLQLYRDLKDLGGPVWKKVYYTMRAILKATVPMDHRNWPATPAQNCLTFLVDTVLPVFDTLPEGLTEENIDTRVDGVAKRQLAQRSARYTTDVLAPKLDAYQLGFDNLDATEMRNHGAKYPISNAVATREHTLNGLCEAVRGYLYNKDEENELIRNQPFVMHSRLCRDPFLFLLKGPDAALRDLEDDFGTNAQEVAALKAIVEEGIPADQRVSDDTFVRSFGTAGYGLDLSSVRDPLLDADESDAQRAKAYAERRGLLLRLKRLHQSVAKVGEQAVRDAAARRPEADPAAKLAAARRELEAAAARRAAQVIYKFGAENDGRCIDGKRNIVTAFEREHVYVAGGVADPDLIIGLNCAKLFLDHRMETLRKATDALFDEGEARTYAWDNTHRALILGFGLSGMYDDRHYQGFVQHIAPAEFVQKYFEGGVLTQGDKFFELQAFTVPVMIGLLRAEVEMDSGLFDDAVLNHMIRSNFRLRQARADCQAHQDDATYQNRYFRNGVSLRKGIKDDAYQVVLERYQLAGRHANLVRAEDGDEL